MSDYPKNVPSAALVGIPAGIIIGIAAGSEAAGFFGAIVIGAIALYVLDDNDK